MQELKTSIAAEQALLSAIIQATIRPSETGLTPEDFEYADHQEIFRAAQELEQKKQSIDLVTMADAAGHDGVLVDIATNGSGDVSFRHGLHGFS